MGWEWKRDTPSALMARGVFIRVKYNFSFSHISLDVWSRAKMPRLLPFARERILYGIGSLLHFCSFFVDIEGGIEGVYDYYGDFVGGRRGYLCMWCELQTDRYDCFSFSYRCRSRVFLLLSFPCSLMCLSRHGALHVYSK
jgi:hypothetical protein